MSVLSKKFRHHDNRKQALGVEADAPSICGQVLNTAPAAGRRPAHRSRVAGTPEPEAGGFRFSAAAARPVPGPRAAAAGSRRWRRRSPARQHEMHREPILRYRDPHGETRTPSTSRPPPCRPPSAKITHSRRLAGSAGKTPRQRNHRNGSRNTAPINRPSSRWPRHQKIVLNSDRLMPRFISQYCRMMRTLRTAWSTRHPSAVEWCR